MKLNTSKLFKQAENNTKLNLSKIKKIEDKISEKSPDISFNKLAQNSPADEPALFSMQPTGISFSNLNAADARNKAAQKKEQQAFSLTFTDNKSYELDTIISNKRRDNSKCPLILKVNMQNENDKEIVELITVLVIDDYLNAGKTETDKDWLSTEYIKQNIDTLAPQVPNFDLVFDNYFNKYYTYYYKQIQTREFKEGSISLDTIKTNIVDSYNGEYDNIIGQELDEYANVLAFNKPMVEYEMGSEPDYDDGNDSTFLDLTEKDDTLYIKNTGGIIPNQTGMKFATINDKKILNNDINIETFSISDYIELIQTTILLSGDSDIGLGFKTSDGYCITVQEEK